MIDWPTRSSERIPEYLENSASAREFLPDGRHVIFYAIGDGHTVVWFQLVQGRVTIPESGATLKRGYVST
jgi:hypothetical protein